MKANRGLTIERMVELGLVSRSGFYRFGAASNDSARVAIWICEMLSNALRCSGRVTGGRGSRASYGRAARR
jgi:hypothetical protein